MKPVFLLFIFSLFAFSADVFAITDEEIFRNFEFSFVNPGARSGAMGGAFVGLADDATAAEANPAGLTILTKPEVSMEYRHSKNDAGRLNSFTTVQETGAGLSVLSDNTLEDLNQLSFLAVVYPFKKSTFAFSRQEFSQTKGGINDVFLLDVGGQQFLLGTTGTQDQKIVNYNFSFGTKLTEHFSAGATLRASTLDWNASVQNVALIGNLTALIFRTDLNDSDNAFAFNVGGLYTAAHFSLGAVYKRNPRFEVTEVESGPVSQKPGPFTNVLKVPDTFGVGGAVKPNDNITIVADVVRIQYSDLTTDIEVGRNLLTASFTSNDITYKINDAWDFHTGTEFVVFTGKVPVALRVGYYRKSSSSLLVDTAPGLGASEQTLRSLFTEREDENHFTMGNGFVFGPHFQIDWSLDLANITDSFVLSSVVRF
jgi:long-chain fatty acid transport protein